MIVPVVQRAVARRPVKAAQVRQVIPTPAAAAAAAAACMALMLWQRFIWDPAAAAAVTQMKELVLGQMVVTAEE